MSNFDLSGQCAFVTGAGRGIGQAVALALAEAGADVGCFDMPDSEALDETVAIISERGRKGLALRGDVRNPKDLEQAVASVESDLGNLTVAANCAGIATPEYPAEDMQDEIWQRMIDVNLTGVFRSCQAEAKVMLPRGKGAIVNIASMSGSIINRDILQVHYNTSKAGVSHMTKSLAMEWCQKGVRVNAVSPGYTGTPMVMRPELAEKREAFSRDTPLGSIATVEQIAWPVVFLCSDAASYITGHDLLVDGGFTCW